MFILRQPSIVLKITFAGIIIIACAFIYLLNTTYNTYSRSKEVVIYVPKGTTTREIGELLVKKKIINSCVKFVLASYLLGKRHALQAGEFLIPKKYNIKDIIYILTYGRNIVYKNHNPGGLS